MPYTYSHPRPAVTVDAVIFGYEEDTLKILLIKRGQAPFKNKWALPGGFVNMNETLDKAVLRELKEETGLTGIKLEQFNTYGAVKRDPRGRTISVAYTGTAPANKMKKIKSASDAAEVMWHDVKKLPGLAFDHRQIIRMAVEKMRSIKTKE